MLPISPEYIVAGAVVLLIIILLTKTKKGSAVKSLAVEKAANAKKSLLKSKKDNLTVKKFSANCDFGGQPHSVTFYIGNPNHDSHPLQFQSTWLSKSRGGSVPASIMDSFSKIAKIAEEKHVPFPELCQYVIEELKGNNSLKKDAEQGAEFRNKRTAEKLSKVDSKNKPAQA